MTTNDDTKTPNPLEPARVLFPAATPEDKEMFSTSKALEPAFQQRETDLADALGLTTAQREARRKAFTDTIRETGLDANVIGRRLFDLSVDAEIASVRGDDDDEQLASRVQRDNEETRQQLASLYGREEAEKLLVRAQKFVKQQPKLNAMLATRGIGSRPDVVLPIVEHIRRVNFR